MRVWLRTYATVELFIFIAARCLPYQIRILDLLLVGRIRPTKLSNKLVMRIGLGNRNGSSSHFISLMRVLMII